MWKKFLSRKLLVIVLAVILDILVITGVIAPNLASELKIKLVELIAALAGAYCIVEGVIDSIKKAREDY